MVLCHFSGKHLFTSLIVIWFTYFVSQTVKNPPAMQETWFFFFNKNLFIQIGGWLLYNIVVVLPYIDMNLPWVYMCSPSWTPLPPPSPSHPSGSSQCTSPKHPVSCIEPGPAIRFTYDNKHVSMPFSQIIPPMPFPTESKRLFYTCVPLLLGDAGQEDSWVKKIPWRRKWQPTPVFVPGESQGLRSLVGYSPWGGKELDMTERLTLFSRLP